MGSVLEADSNLTTVPIRKLSRFTLYERSCCASGCFASCALAEMQNPSATTNARMHVLLLMVAFSAPFPQHALHSAPFCVACAKRKKYYGAQGEASLH